MRQVGHIAGAMITAAHQSLYAGAHEGDSKLDHRRSYVTVGMGRL